MRILLNCQGFDLSNRNLQPWVFFDRVARELARRNQVILYSQRRKDEFAFLRFSSNQSHDDEVEMEVVGSDGLRGISKEFSPEVIIDSIGPLSTIRRGGLDEMDILRVGIMTYPLYDMNEIWSAGLPFLIKELSNSYQHIIGTMSKHWACRLLNDRYDLMIAESRENAIRMKNHGICGENIRVIRPGVDEIFLLAPPDEEDNRAGISYFGSALPLRGAQDLIKAYSRIRELKLDTEMRLFLRRDKGTERHLDQLRRMSSGIDGVTMKDETLSRIMMLKTLRESKVAVFPFRLVPSEMPIAPLEALACGCQTIVPDIDGLSDLSDYGAICYHPGDIESLSSSMQNALLARKDSRIDETKSIPRWTSVAAEFERALLTKLEE